MESYVRTTDPIVHLRCHTQHMNIVEEVQEEMCRCFPLFLYGLATTVFSLLDLETIYTWFSWSQISWAILECMSSHPKMRWSLEDIKQNDCKTLRSYLVWFNVVGVVVCQPDEWIVHIAVVSRINRRIEFYRELKKNPISDLEDFYFQADKYMRLEDADIEAGLVIVNEVGYL